MSNNQTREYLNELITKGSISYDPVTRTFRCTRQGIEYLRLYDAMKKLGNDFND